MKKDIKKTFPQILVSGSVSYDNIFSLTTPIAKQIVLRAGVVGRQNMMFSGNQKEVYFGGTGGNIAYGLSILGASPILVSGAGKDFGEYAKRLKSLGVKNSVFIDRDGYTAMFYGMTDPNKEQIGIFQPNSYHSIIKNKSLSTLLGKKNIKDFSIAIFSPGNANSILKNIVEFRKLGRKDAFVILDPGQMVKIDFTKKILMDAVSLSDMLILNEQEAHFIKHEFSITHENLFEKGLKYFLVTYGNKGSVLYSKNEKIEISANLAKKVVDPTGAGDAYRAGLIYEIARGGTIKDAMKKGSILGARCVASPGCQTYKV